MISSTKIAAILNITPDSFSDGDMFFDFDSAIACVHKMIETEVDIIDIGAESTRLGAKVVSSKEEIARLEKIVPHVADLVSQTNIKISLDSRNFDTLEHFIDYIDIINDVTGLQDQRIQNLALTHNKRAIFMHSLAVPVDGKTVADDIDIIEYLQHWLYNKVDALQRAGFKKEQLIFDPGLGFGVSGNQSLEIVKRIEEFRSRGIEIMVGHSRKSFLAQFGEKLAQKRDPETHALTFYLASQNVNYVRVHDFESTKRILKLYEKLDINS